MKQLITAQRVRAIIGSARTEKDVADVLRAHRIRYGYSTEGGAMHIRIPARSGPICIYRTANRAAPLYVTGSAPAPFRVPAPALRAVD